MKISRTGIRVSWLKTTSVSLTRVQILRESSVIVYQLTLKIISGKSLTFNAAKGSDYTLVIILQFLQKH
jgi:hypothetical protein